jgi:hypothetical protein
MKEETEQTNDVVYPDPYFSVGRKIVYAINPCIINMLCASHTDQYDLQSKYQVQVGELSLYPSVVQVPHVHCVAPYTVKAKCGG